MPTKSLFTPVMGGGAEPAVGAIADVAGSAQFNGANSLTSASSAFQWNGNSAFSMVLWWFSGTLPSVTQNAWIVSQTTSPLTTSGFGLRANGGTGFLNWEVAQNPGSGNNLARTVPNLSLTANHWYMILVFQDPVTARIYASLIDATSGTEIDTNVSWATPGAPSAAPLTLGSGPSGTDSGGLTCINTNGRIDSFGFWNRLLTGAEQTTLKNLSGGLPKGVDWSQISSTSLGDAAAFYNLDGRPNGNTDGRDATPNGRNLTNNAAPFGVFVTRGPEKP